jgi:hypothetical protein
LLLPAPPQSPALIFAFVLGYAGIILEEELAFNKSGVALLMAVFLWTIRSLTGDHAAVRDVSFPILRPLHIDHLNHLFAFSG